MTESLATVSGVVAVALYDAGVRRVRCAGTWPSWRQAAMTAGVVVCVAGVVLPLGERFSAHVGEHVLLGMLGPGLVAAGAPLTLLARACPARSRRLVRQTLRSRGAHVLTHPVAALALAAIGPWILWLTPLNRWQLEHEWVHALVHVHLVVSGFLFGVAILGLDQSHWRRRHATRLFGATLALPLHTLLGLILLSASTPYLNPGL
ncbi:MAG TPA: cytochrome c oxidase assembly protein, partial [Acidimicrobiales bacterium]